ncbi:hypothetical protein MLD52_04805 [Puniceicoccaceae bacterium K14]|nr:hypothetical protein [Puniceicoccaceae bacterium K14]
MDIAPTGLSGSDGMAWKSEMLTGNLEKQQQVDELAKEFENILVRQFLDKALTPMDKDSGMFGMKSSPMYEHLVKDTLANSITGQKSLGFSSVLQTQLLNEADNLKTDTK